MKPLLALLIALPAFAQVGLRSPAFVSLLHPPAAEAPSFSPNDLSNLVFAVEAERFSALNDGDPITVLQCPYTGELATNIGTVTKQTVRGQPVIYFGGGGRLISSNALGDSGFDTALSLYLEAIQTNDTLKVVVAIGAGAGSYNGHGNTATGDGVAQKVTVFNINEVGFNSVTANGELVSIRYDGANKYFKVATGATTSSAETGDIGWNGNFYFGDLSGTGFNTLAYVRSIYFFKSKHEDSAADQLAEYRYSKGRANAPNFVFLGNSLTAGTGGEKLTVSFITNLTAHLGGEWSHVYNEAVSGQTFSNIYLNAGTQVLNKIYTKSTSTNQVVVVAFPFTNDHSEGFTTNDLQRWVTNFATLIHSNQAKFVITDDIARSTFDGTQNGHKLSMNLWVSNEWAAGRWFDGFVSMAERFTDHGSADYTDGTHLTPAATREAQDMLWEVIPK